MTESDSQTNVRRLALLAGLALLAAYAWSAYAPPPRLKYVSPTEASSLLSRLFPGVDVGWILARLAALGVGLGLTLWALPRPDSAAVDAPAPAAVPPHIAALALACAGVHVALMPWAASLPPLAQGLYILWLLAPALVVAGATGRTGTAALLPLTSSLILIAAWYVIRLSVTGDDPRIASAVDLWRTFNSLVRFAASEQNLLTDSFDEDLPGVPATPLFFSGLPLLHLLERLPSLAWSQLAGSTWLALAAVVVANLTARMVTPAVAPIAVAALLASPFILLMQMVPDVSFIGPVLTAFIIGAGMHVFAGASPSAFLLLCPLLGMSVRYPALIGVVGVFGVIGVHRAVRSWRQLSWPIVAAGALSFIAIAVPGLPSPSTVATMVDRFVRPGLESGILQEAVLHQKPLDHTKLAWGSAKIGKLDIPVAAALTPFAVPRTDMRLMGDVLFEPTAAALAGVGFGLCLLVARRDRQMALLALLLLACLAPGSLSNMDRTSFGRMFGAPVPMALLTAVGFAAVRRRLPVNWQKPVTAVTCVAMLAGGMFLFDEVNPRITRRSALGLALEALAPSERGRAVLLLDRPEGKEDWTFSDLIATHIGPTPLRIIDIGDDPRAAELPDELFAEGRDVLLWSRPVEGAGAMSRRLCQRWPDAAIYAIRDAPGFSLIIGAQPSGQGWKPALPQAQWRVELCRDIAGARLPVPERAN